MYKEGQLWAVKRRNADHYATGYYSYSSPKLYVREGDASRSAKKLNEEHESYVKYYGADPEASIRKNLSKISYYTNKSEELEVAVETQTRMALEEIGFGRWVVVPVEITVRTNVA